MPLATVSPAKLTSTFIKKLEAANFNYVITVASKNITQGGKTGGGEWIDVIRFRDWLQNDMQVRVVTCSSSTRRFLTPTTASALLRTRCSHP